MDDQMKIYDTVRGNQLLYYNPGYNTTNSTKMKKNSNHWTNIFTWKKKNKQTPNSIINYPFMSNQKYSSMSAATGIAYAFAPPPGRLPPPPPPVGNTYATPDMNYMATTTTTTTIHASVRHNPAHRQIQNRNSLFYSPWETFHDHSAQHMPNECTCQLPEPSLVDTYCSKKEIPQSLRGLSPKSVPMIASADEPIYESRRLSRMDLYSVEEENSCQQKSKSSDSLLDMKKSTQLSNGLKSSRSSTTLSSNPFAFKSRSKDPTSATVNERFLKFFKKSAADPYSSIASRKSILECDVSAYDLIKQKLELKLFEDDDSLSDNAIENENNCEEVVGNVFKSNGRKSFSVDSQLNESNIKSNIINEPRHSIVANSVRIGGYGMSFAPPAPKYKPNNQNKTSLITYSLIDSNSETPSTSSWSGGSGVSNDSIPLPEPDYDIDDNIDYQTYGTTKDIGNRQENIYSPPLDVKRVNYINTEDVNKQIDEIHEKSPEREQTYSFESKQHMNNNEYNINHSLNDQKVRMLSVATNEPPSPPPEPPVLPLAPVPNFTINKSLIESKSNSSSPNVSSYQCELKDKLNSGVKSILKKTKTQSNSNLLSKENSLSKSETDLKASTSGSSDSCDYLRTFKEFKESRLRPNGRHRRVHFKSQSHDRLLIDEISAQTIPEVEESDEPIYDDVRLPGAGSVSDDDSVSCGQQTINDKRNDCHKSEQLNAMSESLTSDNRIIKSVTNDNYMTNDSPMRTPSAQTKGPVEFAEFDPSSPSDPSEDLSQSSSTITTATRALAAKTHSWQNRVDLKTKHNSLIESRSNISANDDKNNENSSNCIADKAVTEEMRGPAQGSSKNAFPSPAANTSTAQSFSTGAEFQDGSNANQLKIPVAQRKYLPVVSTESPIKTPVAKPRDDRQQGKQINRERSEIKGPVAQVRAYKSLAVSLTSDKSYLSPKEEKMIETIGDQKCKEIIQTLLPVSQDSKFTQNYVQKNKNSLQLYESNVRNEKQTQNNSLLNKSTEIEILGCNQREAIGPTIQDNSLQYHNSYELLKVSNSSIDEGIHNKGNPYLCTISIKNGSNNQIINQTTIEGNVNNVCVSGISSIPFESIDSSHSSSFYDSGAQSFTDSLTNDRSLKSLNESPITVLCANSNDKIVINVPSDHTFDNINEHIYEELDTESIYVDTDGSMDNVKSIFDGASKDEILEFLEDAKERVGEDILVDTTTIDTNIEILEAIDVIQEIASNPIISATNRLETSMAPSSCRRNRTSNVSNSSTDSTATTTSSSIDIEDDILKCAITNSVSVGQLVERNDSGVGAETSKPSRHRKLSLNDEVEHQCADCEMHVDPNEDDETGLLHYPLFCHRCDKKRSERKEIISEIVDTEFKYGRDLRIIREEFYRPIEIAGLLTKEQLRGVFLNLDELISVNSKFSEKLQDAIDIATEQGDEDFTTVNIGKLFRDSSSMLHSFEVYCVRQGSAALLLNHLEKEKELLRIFLRVSQMENTLLRRMNLRSFLVVPVQRVTKYPLLLNRLYKVTPYHHRDREALRESQQKVELHLEHINQQTKGTIGATTRIWRRISNLSTSHRRLNNADDIGNIKLRKAALEILKWNQEETQFVIIGKVFFTSITDYTVNRKTKTMKFLTASALLATLGRPNQNYRPDLVHSSDADKNMVFTRDNTGISDAVLLLIKEKCGRYALCKEILNLKSCVISTEMESGDEMFEIHEQNSKESLLLKAETVSETKDWLKQLKYHSKDLGNWRRRRNALANIMMVRQ